MPALLTTTSSRPASRTALSTAALTSFALATSARSQRIAGWRARAASSASCRRPSPKTVAPASANATAIASPIPEFAPVTRTTFPKNDVAIFPSYRAIGAFRPIAVFGSHLGHAAVDDEVDAGHVAAVVRRQEERRRGELLGTTDAPERRLLREHLSWRRRPSAWSRTDRR